VSTPPRILAVDDDPNNLEILAQRLSAHGYQVLTASDGEQALASIRQSAPDLVLLDVMMPGLDGIEVCRQVRADATLGFTPIILITARSDTVDVVTGLDAGADEYLTKPLDHAALLARVRSMLRIKELHDIVRAQSARLADWNRDLEDRVQHQVAELERFSRLRRFLAPQIAELIVAGGEENLLESHRRQIVVVCCSLNGFTGFSETAAPEEVLAVLQEYRAVAGELIAEFAGTLAHSAGPRLMVAFNDPVPLPEPAGPAVRMVLAMREQVAKVSAGWARRGYVLGFTAGMSMGYATLGVIGTQSRLEYAAVGPVMDLAERLCEVALPDQILVTQAAASAVDDLVELQPNEPLNLRGFARPVNAYTMVGLNRQHPPGRRDESPLSAREEEVAGRVAQGLTNREIAEALIIAERTVASHVEHILDKLGFSSRTQIGVWAAERLRHRTPASEQYGHR
jgi:adenylate cyclase